MNHYRLFLCGLILFTSSVSAFDHKYQDYAKILKNYVVFKDSQSLVNYSAIKKNKSELEGVLKNWEKVSHKEYLSWNNNEKLAFLINAYNGFTLKLIVDNYPVKSIKDLGSFFASPWKKEFFSLFGKKSHLDHIEHDLIRKQFKEPRIHFAVNCASLGCPSLADSPYRANDLDKQLEKAAKIFIQNTKRNHFNEKKKVASLSKIFNWYGDDFKEMTGKDYKQFIQKFIPQFNPKEWEIEWLSYDWNLNESHRKKSK
jgi:hypothetical protein